MIPRPAVPALVLLGVAAPAVALAAQPSSPRPATRAAQLTQVLRSCERPEAEVVAPAPGVVARLGVLGRPRTAADALSSDARRALRERGITVGRGEPARLLRTTRAGGRAWIVPVDDVQSLQQGLPCLPAAAAFPRGPGRAVQILPPVTRLAVPVPAAPPARPLGRRRPDRPRPAPRGRRFAPPLPAPPPSLVVPQVAPRDLRPALAPPATVVVAPSVLAGRPAPGAVVVATGDAAPGGGGAFADLVKGAAPVSITQCVGGKNSLVSISGLVPDGVGAVYLSATDGTAVRADVRDNGYSFTVPARTPEGTQRFLVWTERDGTPHTQPAPSARPPARLCRVLARGGSRLVQLTPSPGVPPFFARPVPVPAPAPRRP